MNTQRFVSEVNSLIDYINSNSAGSLYDNHREDDGYTDYEMVQYAIDNVEVSISYLFADVTNPTLPCLPRLVEAAKRQGYFVDYRAAA